MSYLSAVFIKLKYGWLQTCLADLNEKNEHLNVYLLQILMFFTCVTLAKAGLAVGPLCLSVCPSVS